MTFRFEYFQNIVTKHHMGPSEKIPWEQAATWAWKNDLKKATICKVEQISPDEVMVLKRYDRKLGKAYWWFNQDSTKQYERIIINRADKTVAIDRIDTQFWRPKPFLGRRDFFYLEKRENKPEQMTFVRHDFWRNSLEKFPIQLYSHLSAWSYRSAFKNAQRV